ncbi:MAG: reverse transcriptase-like protein [Novosphingobium sp.]
MARPRVKVYFDGGARPNPGRMEAAVVLRGAVHLFDNLGEGTNTQAEWLALIHALRVAQAAGLSDFDLIGDSATVIDQANDKIKCRSAELAVYLGQFTDLSVKGGPTRICRIPRAQNLAGIALETRRRELRQGH